MRLHCLRERQHDQEQDQRDRCTEQYVSPDRSSWSVAAFTQSASLRRIPRAPAGLASRRVDEPSPSPFAAETQNPG